MSDLDAFLAGIVADPHNALRWLVMADWLEDHGFPERAELVRVHRELLRTCTDPDAFPERADLHARMMELMRAGVQPCLPQKTLTLPGGVELRMSFIPPGAFRMGSPKSELRRDVYEDFQPSALGQGFYLGIRPVTQAQWVAVMGTDPSTFNGADLPVERVSWDDAVAFCLAVKELTGVTVRLPASAEWEYACRAGTTTPFHWGTELNGAQANCRGDYPYGTRVEGPFVGRTTPVGRYEELSPHPWGLADLHGNVWEWCADALGDRTHPDETNPFDGARPTDRVIRGGSWSNPGAEHCRAASWTWAGPAVAADNLGFRVAADAAGT